MLIRPLCYHFAGVPLRGSIAIHLKGEILMRKLAFLLAGIFLAGTVSIAAETTSTRVEGYIVDSACAFVKNVKKPLEGGQCAVDCAKSGSPLVLLTDDGKIYWPISDEMPAKGQNARLMEYAGKRVTIQAKALYERGGSNAMVIDKIEVKADSK